MGTPIVANDPNPKLLELEHRQMLDAPCTPPVWTEHVEEDGKTPYWKCNLHAFHVYVKPHGVGFQGWVDVNVLLEGVDRPKFGRRYSSVENAQQAALKLAKIVLNKTNDQLAQLL